MPTKCGKCGVILDPSGKTNIVRTCSTCLQTEKLQEIAKREEMRNRLDRERQERERSQEQSRRHYDKLQEDRMRREQERSDTRERNAEVVRQYEALEDHQTESDDDGNESSSGSQSYGSQSYYEAPKNRSCLGCLFKLVILAVVGFLALAGLGYFLDKGGNKKSEKKPAESNSENIKSDGDTPETKFNTAATPDQETSSHRPGASTLPGKSSTSDTQTTCSFENQQFPLYVAVTNEARLLNNEGKEIVIPKGSMLKIDSRSAKGTLTLTFEGKLFVGNESRLLGKVKIR